MSSSEKTPQPTEGQIAAAIAAVSSTMPLTALDDEDTPWGRFAGGLAHAVAQRNTTGGAVEESPSYFCFVERPNQYANLVGAKSFNDMDMDLSVPISGRLLLVSENANGGVAFEVKDQAEMWAKLADLSLGDVPAAAFYPSSSMLRYYPNGFNDVGCQFNLGLHPPRPTVTETDIKEVIDLFHQESLCTPQLTAPVFWENQSKWLPEGSAEKNIQWPLKIALVFGFKNSAVVKAEELNSMGDADFTLYAKGSPAEAPPVAIVEVKVQKSERASGDVPPSETCKEYIRGLVQTAAYRNRTNAAIGMLACFDLRKPGAGSDAAWQHAQARVTRAGNKLDSVAGGRPSVVSWMVFADTQSAQAAGAMGPLRVEDYLYPVTRRPDIKAQIIA